MSSPERSIRILVIDDEESIRRALQSILSLRKYDVTLASGGADGIEEAIETNPELVILDLSLPDMDGLDVCRELRTDELPHPDPLSQGNESDKVQALDLGADDYLTKPFQAGAARQDTGHSPSGGIEDYPASEIVAGDLTINLAKRQLLRQEQEISFTRRNSRFFPSSRRTSTAW